MTQVTLEVIHAKQNELAELTAAMIKAVTTPKIKRIEIPAAVIELRPGEHYAGEVLNEDGTVKHRLALAAVSTEATYTWEGAEEFAKSHSLRRPTVPEARLLLANCKHHLPAEGWFWTDKAHDSNAASAWLCTLHYGYPTPATRATRAWSLPSAASDFNPSILLT